MSKLDEVIERKLDEIDEMSVTDDGFKEATQGVSSLIDANTKTESTEPKWLKWLKGIGIVAGIASPFVLKAMDQSHDKECLRETFEYEKTGAIMSTGGKHVLSNALKFKH